jgi:Asp-tRNA(Asn)/Glu-tRNA(Gln) amidotransferase A subunit family amidase
LGLHLIAKPFDEATLFRAAQALEEACGFATRPPGFGGNR